MTRIALNTMFASLVAAFITAVPATAQDHLRPNPFQTPASAQGMNLFTPPTMRGAYKPLLPAIQPLKSDPFTIKPATSDLFGLKPTTPDLFGVKPADTARFDFKWTKFPRVMDASLMPAERARVLKLAGSFPLLGKDFEVLGAGTADVNLCATKANTHREIPGTYNCIAHTAGIKNLWVNPYQTTEGWNMYYNPLGFTLSKSLDTREEAGVQKVAVYATKTTDRKLKYQHAAIQDTDGTWTSKLGSGPLIRHRTAEAVCGPSYGEVVLVYTRKK